jgi:hypothetical protein
MYRILLKNDDGKTDPLFNVPQLKGMKVNNIFYTSLPAEDDPGLNMTGVKGDFFHGIIFP